MFVNFVRARQSTDMSEQYLSMKRNESVVRDHDPWSAYLGRVVQKPIKANPRLKVNQGFHLAH